VLPKKLITFIGPLYGNVLTPEALAVGLQVYMGKDFAWYTSGEGQQLYLPSRRGVSNSRNIFGKLMKSFIDDHNL
jgi:hypothetical protein